MPMGRALALGLVTLMLAARPGTAAAQVCAYAANAGDGTVSLIDTGTNTATLAITVGAAPHGVAVVKRGSSTAQIYVANSGESSVSVIDTSTQTAPTKITVESGPEDIAVLPDGSTAYVSHPDSGKVSVIDTASGTPTTTVDVGGKPMGLAASPDGKMVYVTDASNKQIVLIDTKSNTTTGTPFQTGGSPDTQPVDVAVTSDGTQVYVSSNRVVVIATSSGLAVAALQLQAQTQTHGITITPDHATALLAVQDATGGSLVNIATDPSKRTFPLPVAALGPNAVPIGVAAASDSKTAYVSDSAASSVDVVDITTNSMTRSIPVGSNPQGVAIVSVATGCGTMPTPTATAIATCVGDCNGNGVVGINELVIGVNIALDLTPASACVAFQDQGGMVTISQLIKGVNNALNGCPA